MGTQFGKLWFRSKAPIAKSPALWSITCLPAADSGAYRMQPNDPFKDLLPKPTTDDIVYMRDDVEDMKYLLQRNDRIVIAGGPVIAWWGFTGFVAGLWNFTYQYGFLPHVPVVPINAIAGYIGMFIIIKIMGTSKTLKLNFQAISAAWTAITMAIPFVMVGMLARHIDDELTISAMQAVLFATAMAVTAMGSRKRWLLIPTFGWAATATAFFFFLPLFWRPLVFAASCMSFLTIPGLLLHFIARRQGA